MMIKGPIYQDDIIILSVNAPNDRRHLVGFTPECGTASLPPRVSRWGKMTCTPATVGSTQRQMCMLSANVRNPTLDTGKLGSDREDREDRVQNEKDPWEAGAESTAKSHHASGEGPPPLA